MADLTLEEVRLWLVDLDVDLERLSEVCVGGNRLGARRVTGDVSPLSLLGRIQALERELAALKTARPQLSLVPKVEDMQMNFPFGSLCPKSTPGAPDTPAAPRPANSGPLGGAAKPVSFPKPNPSPSPLGPKQ